jgi:hypothetical protein
MASWRLERIESVVCSLQSEETRATTAAPFHRSDGINAVSLDYEFYLSWGGVVWIALLHFVRSGVIMSDIYGDLDDHTMSSICSSYVFA